MRGSAHGKGNTMYTIYQLKKRTETLDAVLYKKMWFRCYKNQEATP